MEQRPGRWVSNQGPAPICGIVGITTLERNESQFQDVWNVTMTTRKIVTNRNAAPVCKDIDESPETLRSTDEVRALPCKSVKAGALTP